MSPFELLVAAVVLLLTVGVGTVVHELMHATVLRASGVDFEFRWFHGSRVRQLGGGLFGTWASVELTAIPPSLSPWRLRAASLAPLLLTAPLMSIPLGVVSDPFADSNLILQVIVIGWFGCALPSPQDFSLVFHAGEIIADESQLDEPEPPTA